MTLPSVRRLGIRVALTTSLVTVVGALVAVSPAEAAPIPPDSRMARSIDSAVRAQCKFSTTRLDRETDMVTGRLAVSVSPRGFKAFQTIGTAGYYCVVRDGASNSVSISAGEPGRRVRATEVVEIPRASRYTVCVQGIYQTHDGTIGATDLACA